MRTQFGGLLVLLGSLSLCWFSHGAPDGHRSWLRELRAHPGLARSLVEKVAASGDAGSPQLWRYYEGLERSATYRDQQEADCLECESVMGMMREALHNGSRDDVMEFLVTLCFQVYGNTHERYCPGLIEIQGRTGLDMLMKYNGTNTRLCKLLNDCIHRPEETTVVGPHSRKDGDEYPMAGPLKESYSQQGQVKQNTAETFTVMQLTDVHINPEYAEGSATDCRMPACCYWYYGGSGSAGKYGDYKCNVPERTVQLFINKTTRLSPRPAFVLFTGDNAPHKMHNETYESQLETTRLITNMFKKAMPGWRVYPAIGNHEMFPTNIYHTGIWETQNMTREMGHLWTGLAGFGPEQLTTWNHAGYYTLRTNITGLRILGFNSNFGYTFNFYNPINIDRPEYGQQMDFIRSTLQAARTNGEKVMLVGHHCPGRQDTHYFWGHQYSSLVRQFHDVIVLQVFGHSHKDQFQVIPSEDGSRALSVAHISPSVTGSGGVNPSMRLYTFNASTFQLLDLEQHYFDLQEANRKGTDPEIVKSYSAREEYGLPDLSPASWFELAKRLETDDELLAKFLRNYQARGQTSPECDRRCRVGHVCQAMTSSYDKQLECIRTKMAATDTTTPVEQETTAVRDGAEGTVAMPTVLLAVVAVGLQLW